MQHVAGMIIDGKYQLERLLGRGGMGSVWVGRHRKLDVPVAVKLMSPALAVSADARARFEREAKAAAQLKSPHVVDVRDYGIDGDTPYLILELLDGEDLDARLRERQRITTAEAGRILSQVVKALGRAHDAGIVHRDLKPANLFLARTDDGEVVKVLDFGIARARGAGLAGDATKTGSLLGSPHYMSPEQARGASDLDHRSDLWSLGVILFRALTGQLPFTGDQVGDIIVRVCTDPIPVASRLAPDLPQGIDQFFERVLARDREQRFSSARELADAFVEVTMPTLLLPTQAPVVAERTIELRKESQASTELLPLPLSLGDVHTDSLSAAGRSVVHLSRKTGTRKAVWASVAMLGLVVFAAGIVFARRRTIDPAIPAMGADAATTVAQLPSESSGAPTAIASGSSGISPWDLPDVDSTSRINKPGPSMLVPAPSAGLSSPISAFPTAPPKPATPSDPSPHSQPTKSTQDLVEGKSFDASAAKASLSRASWAVGRCRFPDAPHIIPSINVTVKVTFAPSGSASSVQVNPPLAGTPLGACVVAALRSVSVPPFDGTPVSVTKSFGFQ